MSKKKILMCGSSLSVKGGIVSVIKNYLQYTNWSDYEVVFVPTHIDGGKLLKTLYFIVAYCRIVALMLMAECDIVYLHTAERGSFYRKAILARTANVFKKKVLMHHHAAEFDKFYENLSPSRKRFVSSTLENVDLNITLNRAMASMVTDIAHRAEVRVLYNAVYTCQENPYRIEARNILFLGELGKRKGVYDLLNAIQKLDKMIPEDICFYLCGNGEIKEVQQRVREIAIDHRVAHIGWIDGEKKQEILKNTMLNVLPSYNEGMPMTILETMALGIPNISTRIAAIPEVVEDGMNGILILPGDVNGLVDAICYLVSATEERKRYSDCAWLKIASCFSIDSHMDALKGYLTEMVSKTEVVS